jgi:rhodanese-related sulfurtransferase
MKKVVLLSILGVFFVFAGCTHIQSAKAAPRITKDELKAKLGSPELVLLDVRSHSDWAKGAEKITGAVRMDPDIVDTWAGTLPKDKEVVLYCA